MKESVCLITGATSGIGRATAYEMAKRKYTVVVAGRNRQKCASTVESIIKVTGNQFVDYLVADLSSQEDIHSLSQQFQKKYARLDVLVNNAGTIAWTHQLTMDGIELTFALNHLSYFLLTNLLLDILISSAPARIINVSSTAHLNAEIKLEDIQNPRIYRGFRAYCQSKLANILFTYEIARRLQGTGLSVNAVHPGIVATNLPANGKVPLGWVTRPILRSMLAIVGSNTNQGIETVVHLATSPDVADVTGKYFVDGIETHSSKASYDANLATKLWELSCYLTSLTNEN